MDILRLVITEKCEVKINRIGSIEISEIMTIASRVIFGIFFYVCVCVCANGRHNAEETLTSASAASNKRPIKSDI